MKKFTIITYFFLSFYTSESINVANASNKASSCVEYAKEGFHALILSSNEKECFDYKPITSKKWEDTVFVPTSIVSLCTEGLLNIAGAPAAFWGVANAYSMIDDENIEAFRMASMAIGGVALTRYVIVNIMNQNKYKSYTKSYDNMTTWDRFIKNIDDPVSYFKSLSANLAQKVVRKKEEIV